MIPSTLQKSTFKIRFINKGMTFIDLPSTFRVKSVQSAVPNYFKNCEVPIIYYKYNKPIRSAIFNFNKFVSDLDIWGGWMVQWCWVNFQCRGAFLIWLIVGQGPSALAVDADGGCLDIFTLVYLFSLLSSSLWETARYKLKYCLKGPLNPKQPTNQLILISKLVPL